MRAVGSAILQGHLLRLFPASTGGFGKTAAPKLSQYVWTSAGHYDHGIEYRDRSIQQHAIGTSN